jgi:uncharacterized delta-60 repeat protein
MESGTVVVDARGLPDEALERIRSRSPIGHSWLPDVVPPLMRTTAIVVIAFALIATGIPALASPGDLDTTFGDDGKVTTRFTPWALARDMAIQADGRIVAVGQADGGRHARFALARYRRMGNLDTTFGGDGKVTTRFKGGGVAYAVAIQADAKIVTAGGSGGRSALVRYEPDGTLDHSFGGNGKVKTRWADGDGGASAVAIQADGKIVTAGGWLSDSCCPSESAFALARYNADGTLDSTFSGNGKVKTSFTVDGQIAGGAASGVAIQADGMIVAVGTASCAESCSRFALARFNADGTLDSGFGEDGEVITSLSDGFDEGHAVAIQADGRIVAAGKAGFCCEITGDFGVVRYSADGTLDTAFGDDGKVITNFTQWDDSIADVAIQADGKLVAAGGAGFAGEGSGSTFALARYRADGTLDTTFSDNGKVRTRFAPGFHALGGVLLQANGKIVAAGWAFDPARLALARYLGG